MMTFSIEAKAINSRNAGKMAVYIEKMKTYDAQFMQMYMYFMGSWKQDSELLSQWGALNGKALKQALQEHAALNTPIDKPEVPMLELEPKIANLDPVPDTSDEDNEDPLVREESSQFGEVDDEWQHEEYDGSTPQPGGAHGVKRKRPEEGRHTLREAYLKAVEKKKVEEEAPAKKKAEEEAIAKKNVEEEATRKKKAEEEAATKKKAEEEAVAKKNAKDEAAKKKAEDEAGA